MLGDVRMRMYRCRMNNVGKSKAEVAAERIMQRVKGVTVTPHFCRIEEKPMEFYEQFHILVLGLDSLEARRYMNQVACSFLGKSPSSPADVFLARCQIPKPAKDCHRAVEFESMTAESVIAPGALEK